MHRKSLLTAMLIVFAFALVTRELLAEEVITQPIRTFSGHTGWVNSVAFSPDGRKVLTGSSDQTAKLWDASTAACIRTFRGHTDYVGSVAFSPDGGKVLTSSCDYTAKLWDASTGACIRTFSGHTSVVTSAAFSPDGGKVLTGGGDKTAKLWDASTGACIRTFSGHTRWVSSVAFSPDGGKVLTGSWDYTAKLWDASTGACIRTFTDTDSVWCLAFSPDGGKVLTGAGWWDSTAKLWDSGLAPPPPPVAVDDDFSIAEDSGANSLDVMANDRTPQGYPVEIVAKTDGLHGAVVITGGGTGLTYAPAPDYYGPDSFTYTISDGLESSTATVNITVTNVNDPPTLGPILAPIDPVQVGTEVRAEAAFIDPDMVDTHTAIWSWGDSTTSLGVVSETNGSGTAAGTQTYTVPGIYTVQLTVSDDDGGSDDAVYQYVVVYEPSGGFVTGGGWIQSPAGAYAANPALAGRASFGFNSRYQKGAEVPTGQTQFQFRVADLEFHSTSYQWLVVAGAKAQYKGWGTINGAGNYGFLLTGIDGQQQGGGGVDRFLIKIWDVATGQIVYDNRMDVPDDSSDATTIGGGSIVIHKE